MKTFKGTGALDFRIVVPDTFIQALRSQAASDDATPFLLAMQKAHPSNDEAFTEAILKNGLRKTLQDTVLQLLAQPAGPDGIRLGGTVSPATVELIGCVPDFDEEQVVPQIIAGRSQAPKDVQEAECVLSQTPG